MVKNYKGGVKMGSLYWLMYFMIGLIVISVVAEILDQKEERYGANQWKKYIRKKRKKEDR